MADVLCVYVGRVSLPNLEHGLTHGRWAFTRENPGVSAVSAGRVRAQPSRGRYLDAGREREVKWANRGIVGMTVERFDRMLADQDGRCALCRVPMRQVSVDHDHATGTVRALLCSTCNTGLGKFGDDPDRLSAAAI